MVALSALLTVILLQSSRISCQLSHRFINGSLSQPVIINITFYSRYLKGTVLYLVDYDRNNLLIHIDRPSDNKTSNVSIRYNEEIRTSTTLELCGCDPCEARMTNFHVTSTIGSLNIICNNHGQQQVPRIHTINRENNRVMKAIIIVMDLMGLNVLYTSIPLKEIGCLNAFQYNGQHFEFTQTGIDFLSTCPKHCTPGECNGGRCRPLYPIGPLCDCGTTLLSGPHCNDSMREYVREGNNTYETLPFSNDLNIKLFWKPMLLNKKYCLLNFLHRYGYVTFSTHQTFLLKDLEVLMDIFSDRINSLEVDITCGEIKMKVNNKSVSVRSALFGNVTIRVGFARNQEECDTFEGDYYFIYNSSQLRTKDSAVVSKVIPKWIDKNKVVVIVAISGIFVVVILICAVYRRKIHQRTVTMTCENSVNLNRNDNTENANTISYSKVRENAYDYILAENTYEFSRNSNSKKITSNS